ncbi:helix-turn-helix domain-containing protein, partial [Legionella londiniensis]
KLTEKQRKELIEVVRNGKHQAKVIMHANIMLQADYSSEGPGLNAVVIAENLNVNKRTVHRVRQRYSEEGFEAALYRKPHKQYKPRRLDGEGEARLIAVCCSQAPSGRKSWTLELLADELIRLNVVDKISSVTVHNTLKK